MSVSASFLSRLAVALLVAMGFVVPVEAAQRDEVVQGLERSSREEVVAFVVAARAVDVVDVCVVSLSSRVVDGGRLFVKHRALLI